MDITEYVQHKHHLTIRRDTERGVTINAEEEKTQGYLIDAYTFLMGAVEKTVRLFSVVSSIRTRGSGHKLKCSKFCLNMLPLPPHLQCPHYFIFLPWWWSNTRTGCPGRPISPSLEISKTCLDMSFSNLLYLILPWGGTRWSPEVPSSFYDFCDTQQFSYPK